MLEALLLASLLTNIVLGVILRARLMTFKLDIPPVVLKVVPTTPDDQQTIPTQPPMPPDVFDYIAAESEDHARDSRRRRARFLYNELQDWKLVLDRLKAEDGAMYR